LFLFFLFLRNEVTEKITCHVAIGFSMDCREAELEFPPIEADDIRNLRLLAF
jgi:hypothetical protein